MKTIPLTSKLLKELLNSSNLTARLFTNDLLNCEDYPSDIQFIEASFSGYSPKFLNPILWIPINESPTSYIKYKYSREVIWKNLGDTLTQSVKGYYVTDQDNHIVWFERFDNEITLNKNEATLINIEVEINNYDFPETTITLVIKSENTIPENISANIQNVTWGGIVYPNSFLDLLNNGFAPKNNIICIGVNNKIKPCGEETLQFDLTVTSQGFEDYQENVSITRTGNSILEVNLNQLTIATTTTLPPIFPLFDPFQGLLSVGIFNNYYDSSTSSTSDRMLIKIYNPVIDEFPSTITESISFSLTALSGHFGDDTIPDSLPGSENFTEMTGSFLFDDFGGFSISNITTVPSIDGNVTFFSGTMNEDSVLGKWIAGDMFSASLTFKNSDLVQKMIFNGDEFSQPETTYYLLLKYFQFSVSGNTYRCNPVSGVPANIDYRTNIYDDYISQRDDAFNRIDEYIKNEYVVDRDATLEEMINLSWTEEEQANLDELYDKGQEINIDYQLNEYRNNLTGGL